MGVDPSQTFNSGLGIHGKCGQRGGRATFERSLQLAIDQSHEGPQMEMEEALAELDS